MRATRAVCAAAVAAAFGGSGLGMLAAVTGTEQVAAAATASCTPLTNPGTTGLTAAEVAVSGQHITGTVAATGCDVGIYVGNGITGVTISTATVSGANDAGILAESTSGLTITKSTVEDNGVHRTARIPQAFGISLFGVSTSTVTTDTVTGNAAGGIGLMDNGPFDPGAIQPQTEKTAAKVPALAPSKNDTIDANTVTTNAGGCGIVVAPFNKSSTVSGIAIERNTVTSKIGFGPHGPAVGGIVAQSNGTTSTVDDVTIEGNTVRDAYEAGIIVHAAAPGSSTNTVKVLTNPTVSGNNWGLTNGPTATVGVIVGASGAPGAENNGTVVSGNVITDQHFGIWTTGPNAPTTADNTIEVTPGGTSEFVVPSPGTGYTLAAADGGVFTYGDADYFGSMGGTHLNAPVVGLATTEDQGGYWEAAADGGVFTFGDAVFKGSMGGTHLNAPIVGIAATPYVPGTGGAPATPGDLGYWLVAADGGVFSFGDASFYGSMGGTHLNAPIVGMTPTPNGHGYWLVAADGGVFSFGDASFYGSMGGTHLNSPIVGMAATPDGHGYWLVAADGGVFSFGDAQFYGSLGAKQLSSPVVGMAATPDGHGYWLFGANGAVTSFGDAGSFGAATRLHLAAPVVGGAGIGITPSGA